MDNPVPSPGFGRNPREILSGLIEQILMLEPDQQRRLADVALGMYLQKDFTDKEAS